MLPLDKGETTGTGVAVPVGSRVGVAVDGGALVGVTVAVRVGTGGVAVSICLTNNLFPG